MLLHILAYNARYLKLILFLYVKKTKQKNLEFTQAQIYLNLNELNLKYITSN